MFDTGDISKKDVTELTNQQINGKLALINDSITEHKKSLEFLESAKKALKDELSRRKR